MTDTDRLRGQQKLDLVGTEAFIDAIMEGVSYAKFAASHNVGEATLIRWIAADSERSARAREARIASGRLWDEKAEAVLLGRMLADDGTQLDKDMRRELASHYRWRASKVSPRDYGDKLQVDQTTTVLNLSPEEMKARMDKIDAQLAEALPKPDLQIGGE